MLAYHQHGEPLDYEGLSEPLFQLYRTRTAQCLLRGDIAKCLPYTIEALRLNALADLNMKDDNRRAMYITAGVIVRAAVNMGYHRDPSHSTKFSILQAEYRRRVWSSIITMDNVASFHVDFPRMIPRSDTAEPRNLHDWELSGDMHILPDSRPLTEPTHVTYLIVKNRFMNTLSRVTDYNSSLHLGPYEIVVDIDRALQNGLESIPPHMRVTLDDGTAIPRASTDYLWYPNLQLVGYYHLGMCNLHRRFMVRAREDDRFRLSRERCVASALSLMLFQWDVNPSFYHLSSARQTFTLAPMILFLEMELRKNEPVTKAIPESAYILQLLEQAVKKWEEATRCCEESQKTYQFLRSMLLGYQTRFDPSFDLPPVASSDPTLEAVFPGLPFDTFTGGPLFDVGAADVSFDWVREDGMLESFTHKRRTLGMHSLTAQWRQISNSTLTLLSC